MIVDSGLLFWGHPVYIYVHHHRHNYHVFIDS